MLKRSAREDRGIRSIFADAMDIVPQPRSFRDRLLARVEPCLFRALAIGSGVGAVTVLLGLGSLAGWSSLHAEPASFELMSMVETTPPPAKADRLAPAAGKLAAIATTGSIDRTVAYAPSVIGTDDDGSSTVMMAAVAYAADTPPIDAVLAIDTLLERPPVLTAALDPNGPLARPNSAADRPFIAEDDEEDDGGIIPVPRARPAYVPLELLPIPRPRPRVTLASLAPDDAGGEVQLRPEASVPPGLGEGEPPRPHGQALGFFSTPTDPVKAPPKITVDTPFGVPYVLQTGSVETACLKPDLVDLLRRIEQHYGQKVVITSGFRDRGRQGSLHRQCAAADIEIPGISAASLAGFARTLPSVGGVGTYCHPNMIHVDTGAPRDWKYGCGSFFAMRGAPGKWGRPPATLAARSGSAAAEAAED